MAVIETYIKLNTIEENQTTKIVVKEKDTNSRFLICELYNGKERVIVETGTIVINAKKEDGSSKSFAGSINEDGSVRVPIANWVMEDSGLVKASVSVLAGGETKLSTTTFYILVQRAENPEGEVSEDDPNVDVAVQIVSDAQAAADAAAASAAEAALIAELSTITNAQIDALFA